MPPSQTNTYTVTHVAEANLVEEAGAPGRHVLNGHAVVLEKARRQEFGIDRSRRVISILVEVVAEEFLFRTDHVIDARDASDAGCLQRA